jgi:hypothetical protein
MLQFTNLTNNARIIWLLSVLVSTSELLTSICCTGASVTVTFLTVLLMGQSILVVKLEAIAKNSSRLKRCVVICDTTHQLFELCACACYIVHLL